MKTAGAWNAVEQLLTLAIKSLLVLTSIHENTHAITTYISIQVKVMNLIPPTRRPTRVGSVGRRVAVCQWCVDQPSADMWANVPMGSDSSLLPFHAKEMFVQLHKGFSEIIVHFRYIQIQLDSEA